MVTLCEDRPPAVIVRIYTAPVVNARRPTGVTLAATTGAFTPGALFGGAMAEQAFVPIWRMQRTPQVASIAANPPGYVSPQVDWLGREWLRPTGPSPADHATFRCAPLRVIGGVPFKTVVNGRQGRPVRFAIQAA